MENQKKIITYTYLTDPVMFERQALEFRELCKLHLEPRERIGHTYRRRTDCLSPTM